MLLDTGAQVSIINKDKLQSNVPDVPIQDISFILDSCNLLRALWGDEENIPAVGWVDMSVKIERDKKTAEGNMPRK